MKIKRLLKHNLMRAAMTLALILACATAWAQTTQSVTYIDENGQQQTVDATLLTASTYSTNMSGWYVASGTFTNNNRLMVNYDYATLNLILADDCHLTMTKGLQVPSHATLNIYSQSKGSSMGKLTITAPNNYAGIGGSANPNQSIPSGNINIYGGDLNITGGSGGAGIGGGRQAAAQGAILITNGAKVVATGGFGGAGIGGGYQASFSSITITGNATVTASATNGGEAIGRGQGASQSGTLSITNSTVNNVHYDADGFQDGSTHTVTFNSQGGTAVAAQTVGLKYGQTIVKANEPTVPTRTYYVFGGWYKESNCTNAWDFDNDAVTEDITLYAKWTPDPDHFSVSDDGNTYTIHTATGWGLFCDALQDNETYNHFSGDTVKLGANITVTQMAGGSNHAFTGTFDGNHKTLTLNYGTVQAPIDAEFVAPFVEVSGGAEFINLNIDGHIYAAYTGSSDPGVGGLISHLFGGITIEGCTSTVEINSTKDRVGGFVGLCEHAVTFTDCKSSAVVTCTGSGSGFVGWSRDSNYTIAFYGCLFNGKVLKKNGVGSGNGGFVGWKGYHKTVEITNCLVDPAAVAEGETMADDNSATFCRYSANTSLDNQATSITNCYYTETFGNAQGTQAYSISGGDYVTVGNAGTVSNNYTTSGLTFYNVGLKYGDVLYAASNDEVSLTLGCTLPEGYVFNGYTVSPTEASLTGNDNDGYTLTMPNGNVTINATLTPIISYIDENGETQQCTEFTLLTGNETTLGTSGQETWYVADDTLNYGQTITISGNVHLILKDNAVMNVGTEETPINGHGISCDNSSISIYAQSMGESQGQLHLNTNGDSSNYHNGILAQNNGSITINGGEVEAIGAIGIYAENSSVNINSGKVTAFGSNGWGIIVETGNVTINGGQMSANNIIALDGSITINGGQVTANDINANGSSVTINGGQVTANSILVYVGNITLGWSNASDFIFAGSYSVIEYGTLSIAEGKAFIDEAGNTFESGTVDASDINGKTLYPYIEGSVPYIDENGQRQLCIEYNVLTGTETTLGTAGQETWYVVDSDVSFTDLTINGDIHLILVDGKTMNLNHEQGFITLWGQANLTIYGQTNGTGTLSSLGLISAMNITINGGIVNVKGDGFFKEENFIPAIWCAGDMVINGGKVYAQGDMGIVVASMGAKSDDMTTYNFTLNGGQVTAIGMSTDMGIIATGNITLGWTNPTDYIYANKYYAEGTLSIASCKTFVDENNTPYSGTIAQVDEAYAIDGKTLYPDCVVRKQVAGYGEGNGGWVFIASPVAGSIAPSEVHNLLGSYDEATEKYDYDLYRFNQSDPNGKEWQNWNATTTENHPDFTSLVNGQGYLYATKNTKTLVFTGPFITDAESVAVGLEYDATDDHKCWNLVGNPFADTAYVDHDFYVMNALGSEIIAAERDYVNPMEGIFVKAEGEYDDTMTFSLQAPCKGQSSKPKHEQMVINLSRDRGPSTGSGTTIIDRAIVRMGEGQTQPKFQINRNSTKLYIPQGGTDYAIITSNGQGELPLNFKAETDGTYTLSFNAEEVSFSYLHLIDNLTGADVDLLASPTYTFTAKTTDYESRFKLVFSTNDADDTSTGSETEDLRPDDVRTQKIVVE